MISPQKTGDFRQHDLKKYDLQFVISMGLVIGINSQSPGYETTIENVYFNA